MEYGGARMQFWWPGECPPPRREVALWWGGGRASLFPWRLHHLLSMAVKSTGNLEFSVSSVVLSVSEVNSKFSLFCFSLFYSEQFAGAGSRSSSDFYGCNKTLARLFARVAKQIRWDLQTAVELTLFFFCGPACSAIIL